MAVVETYSGDNLIAGVAHTATTGNVIVASGEGALERGTILARNESNKFVVLDADSTGDAEVILADAVDATSADAPAEAYVSGDFQTDQLIVGTGYTLTEADKLNLKNAGIYLVNGVSVNP